MNLWRSKLSEEGQLPEQRHSTDPVSFLASSVRSGVEIDPDHVGNNEGSANEEYKTTIRTRSHSEDRHIKGLRDP